MSTHKTKELVRKCFCQFFCYDGCDCDSCLVPKGIARAARRFVRLEQAAQAKAKRLRYLAWCKKHGTKVDLPEGFGKMN